MKKGFTLTEVFLTLGIIGIIAAMTIPPMIHNTNKKSTIEQLKKSASTLNHAVYNGVVTHGDVTSWGWGDEEAAVKIMQEIITPRLNVGFMCSGDAGNTNKNCNYPVVNIDGSTTDINGTFDSKTRVVLNDGSLIGFAQKFQAEEDSSESGDSGADKPELTGGECVYGGDPRALCGIFMIDVNGATKPNMVGKDIFFYGVYLNGSVLPYGANENQEFVNAGCSNGSSGGDNKSNGRTCAAKLVSDGWDVCYNCENPYPVYF